MEPETATADQPVPTTPEAPRLWAVQFASGGIPQDPSLFDSHEVALRFFVEVAVANDLEWSDDCSGEWIGNDDDEVRLFGPLGVVSELVPPLMSEWVGGQYEDRPFTTEETAEVERILAMIREDKKADQLAREVLAEDATPDRPGGCD